MQMQGCKIEGYEGWRMLSSLLPLWGSPSPLWVVVAVVRLPACLALGVGVVGCRSSVGKSPLGAQTKIMSCLLIFRS